MGLCWPSASKGELEQLFVPVLAGATWFDPSL